MGISFASNLGKGQRRPGRLKRHFGSQKECHQK
jgi:hypothetical protein